jgi:hypothetical protein
MSGAVLVVGGDGWLAMMDMDMDMDDDRKFSH